MTKIEGMEEVLDGVAADAERDVARVLRQLTHDLAGPLSTVLMELHTLERLARRMEQAVASADLDAVGREAGTLGAICSNLERAGRSAADYLRGVERRAHVLRDSKGGA